MEDENIIYEKLAIFDLLSKFTLTIDNHDAKACASLFTENGRFENGSLMIKGRQKLYEYLLVHSRLGTQHITSSYLYVVSLDRATAKGKATTVVIAANRTGYCVVMAGQYDDELVKVNGDRLFLRRSAIASGLPEDPEFSLLNADQQTAHVIKPLLDAWQQLGEPIRH
ncbi:nuclear transport factor 2 family protein [Microbulbifer sp. CnH-101-E]|uniref:nuclear transport factor 2 family protein n=2 Tax=unclassified Microbulbifer TaxID=2619833 RepID=UPI004039653E